MENLDLATLGVEEMNEVQMQEVEGGIDWWMWAISPCTAYVFSRFEKGYGQEFYL